MSERKAFLWSSDDGFFVDLREKDADGMGVGMTFDDVERTINELHAFAAAAQKTPEQWHDTAVGPCRCTDGQHRDGERNFARGADTLNALEARLAAHDAAPQEPVLEQWSFQEAPTAGGYIVYHGSAPEEEEFDTVSVEDMAALVERLNHLEVALHAAAPQEPEALPAALADEVRLLAEWLADHVVPARACGTCHHSYTDHASDEERERAQVTERPCLWAFASSICPCEDFIPHTEVQG